MRSIHMKEIYFDTNVYTHIHNRSGGVTNADVARRILASTQVIEETISAILSSPNEAIGRLRLIHKLAKRKRMIKPHTDFVQAVHAYAAGEEVTSPFISPPLVVKKVLTTPDLEELRDIAIETNAQIQTGHDKLSETYRDKLLPHAKAAKEEGLVPTFEEFWEEMSLSFVEEWSRQAGVLDQCREKGLLGLLEIRPIQIGTLCPISDLYAISYEGRVPKRGDSRDMQHVLLSSATDALVTNDRNLRRLMNRRRIDGYECISFRELLEEIQ